METFTWIASLSINMTPWWFSKWIYFFYLDIFWVCLCALFCLLWFVCLFLYSAKHQHSIGSKWVLQQRATKRESNTCLLGFCLLLCIVFVVSRQAIHCNIFNIFTLCSRIIALLLYVSHQSHFIVQPFQSRLCKAIQFGFWNQLKGEYISHLAILYQLSKKLLKPGCKKHREEQKGKL